MDNILKQAKLDIFTEIKRVIDFYHKKGASFKSLKKYFNKKSNLDELIEDIKHKGNNLFDGEKEYKDFVKKILKGIFDDHIAYEKDRKVKEGFVKTFENFKNIRKENE